MKADENLKPYATPRQWEYYLAVCEYGSARKAAKKLGVSHSIIIRSLKAMRVKAAKQGYSPDHDMTKTVPSGYQVSGTSTLYDADGNKQLQWVKTSVDKANKDEILKEALEGFKSEIPQAKPAKENKRKYDCDCMTAYPVGDHHYGMLAWGDETGDDDYDLNIGRELLVDAVSHLVGASRETEIGALVILGDYLHFDSMKAVTPENRNLLDTDTRFPLMVRAAIEVTRQCISIMLKKHSEVRVIFETGNHDQVGAVWLREMFSHFYESEPRVTIDTSPMLYHYLEFGKNLIMTHHGHGAKMKDLPLLLASTRPESWGRTQYRHIMTGHIHHDSVQDFNGCKVESFRILPPPDAYASGKGYVKSGRDMKSITYHKEFGEIARNIVNPAMLIQNDD